MTDYLNKDKKTTQLGVAENRTGCNHLFQQQLSVTWVGCNTKLYLRSQEKQQHNQMQHLNFILSHKPKKNKKKAGSLQLYFQGQDFKLCICSQNTTFEFTLEMHTLSRGKLEEKK